MRRKTVLGLIFAASFALPAHAAEPDGPADLITRTDAVRIVIQDKLVAHPPKSEAVQTALLDYYATPDRKPLWVDDHGLAARGKAVMDEIGKADDYGLRASDYDLPDADGFDATSGNATDWLAEAELEISNAVLDYARDARGGRLDPQSLSKNLDPTLALPNPGEVLEVIAIRSDPAAYLRSFQPDHPQFEALRKKLIELRGGHSSPEPKQPEIVTIPEGPVLKLGLKHPQVALLRTRLEVPAQDGADETEFDNDVLEAVRRFQSAHGTAPDGLVGAGTRRMLNNPSAAKQSGGKASIDTILANMERYRWLPRDLGGFYVTVNIPEFTLRVVEDDKVIHTARVVTGKPDTQTPILSDEMEEVVFNPYWNVPTSIKANEIAPYLQAGGGFFGGGWDTSVFRRHGLRIRGYNGREIDPDMVDWSRNDVRKMELFQPPGPGNVLGVVKFVFPNKHDVYMHDTTQKHLFSNPVRAESHGCMRVQNPEKFANLILGRDQDWSPADVAAAINGRDDNHIVLQQKIPVHITYFTVMVNDDGSLSTFRDLYGHDRRVGAALKGAPIVEEDVPEIVAFDEERPRQRNRRRNFQNDFTRAIFGF